MKLKIKHNHNPARNIYMYEQYNEWADTIFQKFFPSIFWLNRGRVPGYDRFIR